LVEEIAADQCARKREKGFVNFGESFEAYPKPAELMKPTESALHDPAVLS